MNTLCLAILVLLICSKLQFTAFPNTCCKAFMALSIKMAPGTLKTLRGGSLLGSSSAVDVDGDGMDEGKQGEQRQTDVYLKEQRRVQRYQEIGTTRGGEVDGIFNNLLCTHIKRVPIQDSFHQSEAGVLQKGEQCRQCHDHTVQLSKVARWETRHRHTGVGEIRHEHIKTFYFCFYNMCICHVLHCNCLVLMSFKDFKLFMPLLSQVRTTVMQLPSSSPRTLAACLLMGTCISHQWLPVHFLNSFYET